MTEWAKGWNARFVIKPITLEVRVFDDGARRVFRARAAWDGDEAFDEAVDTPCRPALALARLLREKLCDEELDEVIAAMKRSAS